MNQSTKVIFFGTPDFAVPVLSKLSATSYKLSAVVTTPDKPFGRKKVITASPIKTAAQELGLPVYTPNTLKDEEFFNIFTELAPDLCIVVAYNKILPERYLTVPRLGFINIHPSLLPAYRGPSPVKSAILDGCASTGVSIMLLDKEMDHGPILAQESWTIPPDANANTCEHALFERGADMLIRTLPGTIDGSISSTPQDHTLATVTHKFTRQDGRLNWSQSATDIHNRVRALGDNPGTWTTAGGRNINVIKTQITNNEPTNKKPGTVFVEEKELAVACGEGAVIIEELQLEGLRRQNSQDFINGHASLIGTVLI